MRSFSDVFKNTIKVVSLADEAIVQSDEPYGERSFADVWDEYQKTLNQDLLVTNDTPLVFELKLVRSADEQTEIDKARKSLNQAAKNSDNKIFNDACKTVLKNTLIGVEYCEGFPDVSTPQGKEQAVDALMAHGHGPSLFLTLQQYESRGLLAASNLKKN